MMVLLILVALRLTVLRLNSAVTHDVLALVLEEVECGTHSHTQHWSLSL